MVKPSIVKLRYDNSFGGDRYLSITIYTMIKKIYLLTILILQTFCSSKSHWEIITKDNSSLTTNNVRQVLVDSTGQWITTLGGGLYFRENEVVRKITGPFSNDAAIFTVDKLYDNSLIIGTSKYGAYRFVNERWQKIHIPHVKKYDVWDCFTRNDTSLVLASRYKGMFILTEQDTIMMSHKEGLPDNQITVVTEDKKRRLWIGTARGGACFMNNDSITFVNKSNGLSGNYIRTILCDSTARYIGTWDGGVDYFDGKAWKKISVIMPPVTYITYDIVGRVWIATWGNGVYIQTTKGHWKNIHSGNSALPSDRITDIDFSSDSTVLFATFKGLAIANFAHLAK